MHHGVYSCWTSLLLLTSPPGGFSSFAVIIWRRTNTQNPPIDINRLSSQNSRSFTSVLLQQYKYLGLWFKRRRLVLSRSHWAEYNMLVISYWLLKMNSRRASLLPILRSSKYSLKAYSGVRTGESLKNPSNAKLSISLPRSFEKAKLC